MDNFNLHYECPDEQDDYHALLKKHCRLKEQKTLSLLQINMIMIVIWEYIKILRRIMVI